MLFKNAGQLQQTAKQGVQGVQSKATRNQCGSTAGKLFKMNNALGPKMKLAKALQIKLSSVFKFLRYQLKKFFFFNFFNRLETSQLRISSKTQSFFFSSFFFCRSAQLLCFKIFPVFFLFLFLRLRSSTTHGQHTKTT